MDYATIMATIAAAVTTIYTIKSGLDKRFDGIEKRFDKIEELIRKQGDKISHLEGEVAGIRSMLNTIVGFLLGHKTGTDDKT
jgi:hypothetical protein